MSLIGFWEWRSALLMALSIPVTLSLTFGMIYLLGIDIQQVSVASLIIALGLLVDDPVVAGDSIKRMLAEGQPRIVAPWLGPTKIATAILYATITNIVAYLPFLLVTGNTGEFLYSLPIVMTCALVASRLASMTFIPLLAYYILRPDKNPETPIEERRTQGFHGPVRASGQVRHRASVEGCDRVAGFHRAVRNSCSSSSRLRSFPMTCSTGRTPTCGCRMLPTSRRRTRLHRQVEQVIRQQAELWGKQHPDKDGKPSHILRYVTTWVGGGSPRFWFSLSPQSQQLNYAEVLVELDDKDDHAAVRGPGAAGVVGNSTGSAHRLAATADQSGELSGGDSGDQPGGREYGGQRAGHSNHAADRIAGGRHLAIGPGG